MTPCAIDLWIAALAGFLAGEIVVLILVADIGADDE